MIIITGCHRSGTSLVGQLLADAGFNVGNSLKADKHNSKGYYEDWNTIIKNERLLNIYGAKWDNPPDQLDNGIAQMIPEFDVIKDPRFSLTFNAWVWPEDTLLIKVKRKEHGVVKSLMKRNGFSEQKAKNIYRVYNERLDKIKWKNQITVHYEDLLRGSMRKLNNFVGKKLNPGLIDRTMDHS